MGNAEITLRYDDEYLSASNPVLESGKLVHHRNGEIRISKREGTAVGCGGTFSFYRNGVRSSFYAYVNYEGANQGEWGMRGNNLNLGHSVRWGPDSHLFVDIRRYTTSFIC